MFKTGPNWPSFNGRFAYVRVPYLLRWSDEKNACNRIFEEHVKKHIAPHTEEVLALWSILTRIRKSKHGVGKELSFADKAFLYDTGKRPTSWTQKNRLDLERDLKEIATEYDDERSRVIAKVIPDGSYEGRSGASYREVQNIVVEAVTKRKYLSPLGLFRTLKEIVFTNDSIYEFVKLHQGNDDEDSVYEDGFLEPNSLLTEVKNFYSKCVRNDLRNAAGLISEEEYDKLFDRYISNVKSWTAKEKIQNHQTGAWEAPNESLMRSVEEKMGIDSSEAKERRKGLFNKIAAWSLRPENDVTKGIPYEKLFSDLMDSLRRNSDTEQREQLERIEKHLLKFETEDWKLVPDDDQKVVKQTVDNMLALGYTMPSLKEAVVFVIRHTSSNK
jgi:predicted Ser/Thr protein kinase